jgi:hypothetical protein
VQGNVARLYARMARDLARVPAQRLASRIRSRCIGSSRRSRKRPKAEVAPRLVIQGREGQVVVEVTVSWYVRSCPCPAYMGTALLEPPYYRICFHHAAPPDHSASWTHLIAV